MGSAGLRCLLVAAAVAAGCPAAHGAEEFPARPVRFFVPYAARGDSKPRIDADVVKVGQSPALKASLDKVSMSVVVNGSPAEFQLRPRRDHDMGQGASANDIKAE